MKRLFFNNGIIVSRVWLEISFSFWIIINIEGNKCVILVEWMTSVIVLIRICLSILLTYVKVIGD